MIQELFPGDSWQIYTAEAIQIIIEVHKKKVVHLDWNRYNQYSRKFMVHIRAANDVPLLPAIATEGAKAGFT